MNSNSEKMQYLREKLSFDMVKLGAKFELNTPHG
jgi:hypothetical protein